VLLLSSPTHSATPTLKSPRGNSSVHCGVLPFTNITNWIFGFWDIFLDVWIFLVAPNFYPHCPSR
jgi:hypothetical protein